MYTIIGSDGNQYGPITGEQLRQWFQEGRVTPETPVRAGDQGDFVSLESVPEFGDLFAAKAATLGVTATAPSTPAIPVQQAKNSGMAVTSLVLGILSAFCFVLTALPSIILGLISMSKIKRSGGALKGKGLALAGVIISIVTMVAWTGGIIAMAKKGLEAKNMVFCTMKVSALSQACADYARAHDDTLPTSLDELQPYIVKIGEMDMMTCPGATDQGVASYQIVGAGQKVDWDKAAETPVIRETSTRHMKMLLAGYLDGKITDENTGQRLSNR